MGSRLERCCDRCLPAPSGRPRTVPIFGIGAPISPRQPQCRRTGSDLWRGGSRRRFGSRESVVGRFPASGRWFCSREAALKAKEPETCVTRPPVMSMKSATCALGNLVIYIYPLRIVRVLNCKQPDSQEQSPLMENGSSSTTTREEKSQA